MKAKCKHRNRLFQKNSRCHWCGIEMVLPPEKPAHPLPDNTATIDHIWSRLEIQRRYDNRWVLACLKCNTERGRRAQQLHSHSVASQFQGLTSEQKVELYNKLKGRKKTWWRNGRGFPDGDGALR